MRWTTQEYPNSTVTQMIDRILASGQLNRREYVRLMSEILSCQQISELERHQINRIFDYVQTGRLKLIDI